MTGLPVFIPAAGEGLFGMLSGRFPPEHRTAVVVLRGGGYTVAADRNPLWTPLEDRLGARGYACLRFDYHGVGDSTGSVQFMRPDLTFEEDVEGIAHWLARRGMPELVLIGQCGGARVSLSAAQMLSGLRGLVLIAPPVRDLVRGEGTATRLAEKVSLLRYVKMGLGELSLRRLGDPSERRRYVRLAQVLIRTKSAKVMARLRPSSPTPPWVSPRFLESLEGVIGRRIPTLFVFGTSDGWSDFQAARPGRLEAALTEAGSSVRLEVLSGKVHGRAALPTQAELLEVIWEWLGREVMGSQAERPTPDSATDRR